MESQMPRHDPVLTRPVHRVVDLLDAENQRLQGLGLEEARDLLLDGGNSAVRSIGGSFALVARRGETVRMARSLDRPLRYFLAKETDGPLLVVADRIDAIRDYLAQQGLAEQFHPSYTRMVPAHHVTTLRLVGCPDPDPRHARFVEPADEELPADLDAIGRRYVGALLTEIRTWLASLPAEAPIGVLFSGGIDSGSVLLGLHHELLASGRSAARLKAFTLTVDGSGSDAGQAREFLRACDLEFLLEEVDVPSESLDPLAAVEVIEDYKPRDVECATVALALLGGLRQRYPDWRYLADGDGGDENLKDYPIEENPELTIVSVVNNPLLYQEGWGVGCIKHSQTYSGGQSRGCVRTYAPLQKFGFVGFSPYTRPDVVSIAAGIPFDALAAGSHQALYELKGEIVRRGLTALTGFELPVFDKRRFQEGALSPELFSRSFAAGEAGYRAHLQRHFA